MSNKMIECKNVVYKYEDSNENKFIIAVDDVSFNIGKGEYS